MNATRARLARTLLLAAALTSIGVPARAADPGTAESATASAPARGKPRSGAMSVSRDKRGHTATAEQATRGRPRVAPRILDDTRIEGEIPVPQVLFITARDQRRFMEFHHHHYQVTSLELGRATPGPSRLVFNTPRLTTPHPDKAKQEDPR